MFHQSTFKADVTNEEWLLIKGLKPVREVHLNSYIIANYDL